MPTISPEFEQYIENQGWIVECESPLEIRHEDGSFASMHAAKLVLAQLQEEFNQEKFNVEISTSYESNTVDEQKNKIKELINLNNTVQSYIEKAQYQQAIDNDIEKEGGYAYKASALWDTIYSLVFSQQISKRVYQLFRELNLDFDYYDPDTSYEEDVTAFANALKEEVERIEYLSNFEDN